jgi:hypothetical protein
MIDAAERIAIVAEWKRLAAEPIPSNQKPVGCAVAILAVVVWLASPYVLKFVGSPLLDAIVLGACAVALLWGLVVGFFTGGKGTQHVYGRLEEAQRWFEEHRDGGDAAGRMKAAVALVHFAHFSDGPSTSILLEVAAARGRLGESAGYVEQVERTLIEEVKAWRVFTAEPAGT